MSYFCVLENPGIFFFFLNRILWGTRTELLKTKKKLELCLENREKDDQVIKQQLQLKDVKYYWKWVRELINFPEIQKAC